jgi:hypothetical protein
MTSGNDERDPLDSWLSQQVHPLPPPPGTFELITRRARRRKLRRLAVTVASAAAVAAVAVVAVTNVPALHLTQSPVSASVAAGQRPASPSGAQPQSSASQHTSPSPSPTQSGPASQTSPPRSITKAGGPVPRNFQPVSVTFVSQRTAWVIGQAGTPGKCANTDPYVCTSIARTDDTGKTWRGGPAPGTTGPDGAKGVSGLRFLDGVNGWAFGPELWSTHDAGKTWTPVNTHGQRVTGLETAGDRAFALWATCSGSSTTFAANCTSYTLMTTTASGDNWTPVGAATSELSNGGSATSAMLALTSTTGYLLAPGGALYSGPIDGTWQKVGQARCQPGPVQANGLPANALLAAAPSATVVLACEIPGGVQVYTSADGGLNWNTPVAAAWSAQPPAGTLTSLAAAPAGMRVLATSNGIYVIPAGSSQWKQATVENSPKGGFSYVGMTTASQGVALPADASLHEIWMTFDGGQTWAPRTPIGPGN